MAKAPDRTPWDGVIVTDADTCCGKARFAGTRMYLDHLPGLIEGRYSLDDIVKDYLDPTRAQFQAMMGFTRDPVAAKRNRLKGQRHNA